MTDVQLIEKELSTTVTLAFVNVKLEAEKTAPNNSPIFDIPITASSSRTEVLVAS